MREQRRIMRAPESDLRTHNATQQSKFVETIVGVAIEKNPKEVRITSGLRNHMIAQLCLRASDMRILATAIAQGKSQITASLDFGLTTTSVKLQDGKVVSPDGRTFDLPHVKQDDKTCFALIDGVCTKLRFTGESTGFVYELAETAGRPLLKVGATPFHKWDFIKRIEADSLKGDVLDAGTGLGYTAIAAARTARKVVTVEDDEHVIMLQNLNPWSRGLVARNIERVHDDIVSWGERVPDATFDTVILDGGTPRSSGLFFSGQHYAQVRRILRSNGKLYHYLPDHGERSGRDFPGEVIRRIRAAGFSHVERHAAENYIIAW